jgi:5'-phosphate synthase pdxT subunit
MLARMGAACRVVKKPAQLKEVSGLIIPGGESTTLIKLMESWGFWEPLKEFAGAGHGILGTCAGMILLASEVTNPAQKSLGLIDVTVERNSYGRQKESFEARGTFRANGGEQELPMVFIRAPRLIRLGQGVEPLAACRGEVVMARQGQILVASFHPELTDDLRVHRYFVGMVGK